MLSVIIGWSESGRGENSPWRDLDRQQEFLLAHDGRIEAVGDYDVQYTLALVEMNAIEPTNRDRFVLQFSSGGYGNIIDRYEAGRAFCKAIYEQGIEAFADGAEIPDRDVFNIMVHVLSWIFNTRTFSLKTDAWVCDEITRTSNEDDTFDINVMIDKDVDTDDRWQTVSNIICTLKINDESITNWDTGVRKSVSDPITIAIEFTVDTPSGEFEIPEDAKGVCKALGIDFPTVYPNENMVSDPNVPDEHPGGGWVLMWFKEKDPIAPGKALSIKQYKYRDDAIAVADLSTTIMWLQKKSRKYKIVMARLVRAMGLSGGALEVLPGWRPPQPSQLPLLGKRHMGKEPQFEPEDLELHHLWICKRQLHPRKKDWEKCDWIRIDYLEDGDEEIVEEGVFEP